LGHWKRSGNPNEVFASFCLGLERRGDVGGGGWGGEGWFDLLGSWKRSGKPERTLCEFLLGFGLERRGDGGEV